MAEFKITELTELAAVDVVTTDVLPIVDVSADVTKKITIASLKTALALAIGDSVGSATSTYVPYFTTSGVLAQSANFTYDGNTLKVKWVSGNNMELLHPSASIYDMQFFVSNLSHIKMGNGAYLSSRGTGMFYVGSAAATPTARMHLEASTSGVAHLRLADGATVTSPNNGDIWNDGTNLVVRLGGVSYTLDKTAV